MSVIESLIPKVRFPCFKIHAAYCFVIQCMTSFACFLLCSVRNLGDVVLAYDNPCRVCGNVTNLCFYIQLQSLMDLKDASS